MQDKMAKHRPECFFVLARFFEHYHFKMVSAVHGKPPKRDMMKLSIGSAFPTLRA